MEFIYTNDGYIPYHRVIRIEDRAEPGRIVFYKDGWGEVQSSVTWEMVGDFGPVIPAQPGYFMIGILDGGEVYKDPIIAWKIDGIFSTPIGVESPADNIKEILYPDGQVAAPEDRSWESVEEYRHSVMASRKKRKRRKLI